MAAKITKEDVLRHFFPHFALRLSERYGILITFDEYAELSDYYIKRGKLRLKDGKPDIYIGYLKIHGTEVKVFKSAKTYKVLLSAVPHEDHFIKKSVNSRKFTKKRVKQ